MVQNEAGVWAKLHCSNCVRELVLLDQKIERESGLTDVPEGSNYGRLLQPPIGFDLDGVTESNQEFIA